MPKPEQLARDQSGGVIQIASSFATTNGTQNSPLSYTNAITAIIIPDGAVELVIAPSTDLKISEDSTMTTYDVIVGGSKEAIGCSRMNTIYITRSSGNGTATFRFSKV